MVLNCSHHYCKDCGRHHGHWKAPDDSKDVCNGRCTESKRRMFEFYRARRTPTGEAK